MPSPRARARAGTSATYVVSSPGSREAAWSGPDRVRSVVTCFSSTDAPRATAPRALVSPVVWSDQPTGGRGPGHLRDRAQVALLEGRGVRRDAVEQHGAGRLGAGLDGVGDLGGGPHPGRDEQRHPEGGELAQERGVGQLARRHLQARDAEADEELGAAEVERGAEEHRAPLARVVAQLGPDRRREGQRREERPLAGRGTAGALVGRGVGGCGDEPIGVEGLELDGIRAGVGGDVDEPVGEVGVTVVVDARLRDDDDLAVAGQLEGADAHRADAHPGPRSGGRGHRSRPCRRGRLGDDRPGTDDDPGPDAHSRKHPGAGPDERAGADPAGPEARHRARRGCRRRRRRRARRPQRC